MTAYMRYIFTFMLAFLHLAKGQIPFPGQCPEVKTPETFDLNRYMGTWYEYSKYPFVFEVGQKCQQAVYENLGDDSISVVNTGVYLIINKSHSTSGTAKVIAPGQLAVSFGDQQVDSPNYLVLDTDYDNYAVVFSCKNISDYAHTKLLWILTRERQPLPEAIQFAKKVIKVNNLSETYLLKSIQASCPDVTDSNTAAASTNIGSENSIYLSATSTERVIDTA